MIGETMKTFKIKTVFMIVAFFIACLLFNNCYSLDPPPITTVEDFFVQNNAGIPDIPVDWQLVVDGEVENTLSLTLDQLKQYPSQTQMATLQCNIPFSPEALIGNANWTGVSLNTILSEANPLSGAQIVNFFSVDGYSLKLYLQDLLQRNDIILAYSMNGVPLPLEQGFPVRLVLPGSRGYLWMQWVNRIEVITSLPGSSLTPFPLHSKILTPQDGDTIALGTHDIYGFTLDGHGRDIINIDISFNDGITWEPAQLLNYFVPNVWKHWKFTWDASQVGTYQIFTRVKDSLGNIQPQNGDHGWRPLGTNIIVDYEPSGIL
jgi:DMSO/TMAO reductase YedYZ molybdopterin-dependent catalytic subunit